MTLDLSEIIKKIQLIQDKFNDTQDPTERFALIQALNHIAEKELPLHGWMEDQYREAMLRTHGANTACDS